MHQVGFYYTDLLQVSSKHSYSPNVPICNENLIQIIPPNKSCSLTWKCVIPVVCVKTGKYMQSHTTMSIKMF